jgi:hypothetical protein
MQAEMVKNADFELSAMKVALKRITNMSANAQGKCKKIILEVTLDHINGIATEALEGWRSIETAPHDCTVVEVKMANGAQLAAHWACNLSGEDQPPFHGWFTDSGKGSGYIGIDNPVAWRAVHTT